MGSGSEGWSWGWVMAWGMGTGLAVVGMEVKGWRIGVGGVGRGM